MGVLKNYSKCNLMLCKILDYKKELRNFFIGRVSVISGWNDKVFMNSEIWIN